MYFNFKCSYFPGIQLLFCKLGRPWNWQIGYMLVNMLKTVLFLEIWWMHSVPQNVLFVKPRAKNWHFFNKLTGCFMKYFYFSFIHFSHGLTQNLFLQTDWNETKWLMTTKTNNEYKIWEQRQSESLNWITHIYFLPSFFFQPNCSNTNNINSIQ